MDIKDTEQPPTTLYYLLLQTTTEVITMLEIQLGVTDWLSESSSIILTEKKKVAYGKRNRLPVYSELCPFLPPSPLLSHYSGRALSIKCVLQALESRMKPEFLFHEFSYAPLVIFLCKNFLKM